MDRLVVGAERLGGGLEEPLDRPTLTSRPPLAVPVSWIRRAGQSHHLRQHKGAGEPRTERAAREGPVGLRLDEPVAVGAPTAADEDFQDREVGRDELGDEPFVAVGGVAERLTAVGASVQRQAEGLVDPVGTTPAVGDMAGPAARPTSLRPRLGGSCGTVELLRGRGGDIAGGEVALEALELPLPLGELLLALAEFPVALPELWAEFANLLLLLLEAP